MSKHALVTGGAGGIGSGVADKLLENGWEVTITGISEAELSRSPERPGLKKILLDVTDQQAVDRRLAGFEKLDGLVNCAGILMKTAEFDIENFRKVVEVNLTGTMRMCVASHPLLAKSGGSIVNIASMYSYFGGPHAPAYTASKGGVAQLTKSLAVAWAADGIRVNAVAPGWIETSMTDSARSDPDRAPYIMNRTPMGRWGRPQDVGEVITWFLSDDAGFVTGTILPVDGGYSAA